ncbi:MAG: hypothetical protein WCE90_08345 [Candidatus Zixiibacteriota bacterium]
MGKPSPWLAPAFAGTLANLCFRCMGFPGGGAVSMDFGVSRFWAIADRGYRLFRETTQGACATRPVWDQRRYPSAIARTDLSQGPVSKPLLAKWAESFVFAGSSALLLLIANLLPHYWYFSFFALTPFLYRIIKATPAESLRLGFLLGLSFFSVLALCSPIPSLAVGLFQLLCGVALFSSFGWFAGSARKHWGFSPSTVALLWVGLETGLMKLGFAGGLLGETGLAQPSLQGLVSLFGLLTASAIIVLLNSFLVLAIVKALELTRPRGKTAGDDKRTWSFFFTRNLFTERIYLVPEGRAPPIGSFPTHVLEREPSTREGIA